MEQNSVNPSQFVNPINNFKSSENFFDPKKIIRLLIKNWYLFLITVPLAFSYVAIKHRYATPRYKVSSTVFLHNSNESRMAQSELITGFGLSPEVNDVDNQTIVLKSQKLVKRVIDKLDFGITYYGDGFFKNTELYNTAPFVLLIDSCKPQLTDTEILIKITDNDHFILSIETDGAPLHVFSDQINRGYSGSINITKTFSWGEKINLPYLQGRIVKANNNQVSKNDYFIKIHSHQAIAADYRGKINITPYRESSSIIYLSTTGTIPPKMILFINTLCDVYLEQNLEKKNEIADRTLTFINSQLKSISDSLNITRELLMNFKTQNRFIHPTDFSQKLADEYYEWEKEKSLLHIQKDYYTYLKNALHNDPHSNDYLLPVISDDSNSFLASLVEQLVGLNNEYTLLTKNQNQNSNPYIANLKKKIESARENINEALDKLLENISFKEKRLIGQTQNITNQMNSLPKVERDYLNIERNFKLNDAIYTFLLQKQSETQITKASNTSDNEIIDYATGAYQVSPNKQKDRSQSLLLAFIIPIVIIALKEFLNTKIRDKDELGSIAPNTPILGYVVHNKSDIQNIIFDDPYSGIAESFRALRTKLKFISNNSAQKVFTVTSTNTGEGKTFCALNLAAAFSISGKKTALLGFDLRKPRLSELFNHKNQPGISNYLIGQVTLDDIIYQIEEPNFFVIPSGIVPPNPSELIAGNRTDQLFNELKERFDIIIIDSPPIGVVADARLLMEHANAHLFVVRANYTNKEHMSHTIHSLENENIKSLGFILNDITLLEKGYGYYSSYYGDKN